MRASFKAVIPEGAYDRRDPRAIFQTRMIAAITPVADRIKETAAANSHFRGVAEAYEVIAISAAGNKVAVAIDNQSPLFRIEEGGSKAHTIAARNKPYLRFMGNQGHIVSVREIQHPGTQPRRPLARAFASHRGDADAAVGQGVTEWLSESLGAK